MASNVIRVSVLADATGFGKAFQAAGQATKTFEDRLQQFGKMVVAFIAIKALGAVKDFASGAIKAYSDLSESTNAVEKTFGDAADAILEIGKNSATSFGLSKAEFNSFAVSLHGFAENIAGEGGSIVAVTEKLIKRAADFASIHNIEVRDALDIFQSTLAGQSKPIRAYGKDISDAAVQLFALETGIIDTKREMTEGEKQMARYGLLLRVTEDWAGDFADTADELANKERIVNSQLTDSKALLGEVLAPLKNVSLEMEQGFIKQITAASIALGTFIGELTDGEAALLAFENQTGESVEKIGDVIEGVDENWKSWTHEIDVWADTLFGGNRRLEDISEGIQEFIKQNELAGSAILDMKEELLELLYSGTITQDEFKALSDLLDLEFSRSLARARGEMQTTIPTGKAYQGVMEDVAEATEEAAEETQTAADAIRDVQNAAREAIDPVFAYMEGTRELAEAQAAYNAAVDEFGEDSPEAIQAAEDIARANGKILDAVVDIGEKGVPAAMAALKSLGVPEAVITKFATDRKRIEEIFRNMVLRIGVSAPTLYPTSPSSGGVGWKSESRNYYAHGGIAKARPGGKVIAEAGSDEAMIPMNSEGIGILAAAMKEAIGGGGQSIQLNVNASRSQPLDGWAIIEALQKIEQSSGPLPIRVRPR